MIRTTFKLSSLSLESEFSQYLLNREAVEARQRQSHAQLSLLRDFQLLSIHPMAVVGTQTPWIFKCATGWSKETVDCNFLLTDPKIPKSVKTQWFLGSLYREVLVFWCLKNARCVEFCLSEIFQYKARCTNKGLNTQMLPRRNPNLKQVHKQLSDTLWEAPQTPFSQL